MWLIATIEIEAWQAIASLVLMLLTGTPVGVALHRMRGGAPPSAQDSQQSIPVPLDKMSDDQLEAELRKRRGPAEQTAALTAEALAPKLDAVTRTNIEVTEAINRNTTEIQALRADLEQRERSRTPARGSVPPSAG